MKQKIFEITWQLTAVAFTGGAFLAMPSSALAAKHVILQSAVAAEAPSASAQATSSDSTAQATTDVNVEVKPEPEAARKDVAWLGVSSMEASEALSSQLDLEPGVGLVITYVAPDSPAAKAGLKKNDVLVRFDDQALVHPAQLRKLVRVRKDGDEVKLAFYRAGKKQSASVTLGLTRAERNAWDDEAGAWKENLKGLQRQFQSLRIDDAVRDEMRALRESLGNIKIDQKEVQVDVRRGMEQARKALEEAVRNVTNAGPLRKVLENLAHPGVIVDDKADVVVRSSGKNIKSVVRSDDSGTIVLVSNPKLHLTAHDKEGKLLFDGPVGSEEERAKVPRDLWERVEPLLSQMDSKAEEPEAEQKQ